MSTPAQLREQALNAEKAGDLGRARALLAQAVAAAPQDAKLLNSAGVAYLRWGEAARAADLFAQARSLDPDQLDYPINESVALGRTGRNREAARMLASIERLGSDQTRYWSARGNAERQSYDFAAAQVSYDTVLKRDPTHARALHGRARVALERGQDDALARIERALASDPGDAALWQSKAMALDAAGRSEEALGIMRKIIAQAPQWTEALDTLAQMRLGSGEKDFTDHFAVAANKVDPPDAIYAAWSKSLAGMDRFAEAAEVAAEARLQARSSEIFVLFEAAFAGMAGEIERAEAVFRDYGRDTSEWKEQRARQDIRMGRIAAAETALGELIDRNGGTVNLWAQRGVCWRLLEDKRHEWLHEQAGLVSCLPVQLGGILEEALPFLEKLHRTSALPLGQSVRGGTQTRGRLFQREETVLRRLHDAIDHTLQTYRAALPPGDAEHPLLRHRDDDWRITHSWSVRLEGAGFHTSHIHPLGALSSALYLVVPETVEGDDCPGHLEIGRPPPDLRTGLGPLHVVKPEVGKLALFPSTHYHGTRKFEGGERITIAFDVSAGEIA